MSETVSHVKARKRDAALPRRRRTRDGSQRHKELVAQQLFPGIPDEITLDLITPKLSWRTFFALSTVSRVWKQAIRSGQVYDARVRVEGTETLAVIDSIECGYSFGLGWGSTFVLGLCSGKDRSVHSLPVIPKLTHGHPWLSQCISSDGKIYVIGGYGNVKEPAQPGDYFTRVYVLDVARQRPWEQCKSMGYGRTDFGLGVVGGKIYVFGGLSYPGGPPVTVSEVYDPMHNTWHPFESKTYWRCYQQVWTIGDELFIYGGKFSSYYETTKIFRSYRSNRDYESYLEIPNFLEIYHPGKNVWRKVTPFAKKIEPYVTDYLFIHQGQLHSIVFLAMDTDKKSWTSRRSYDPAGSSIALHAEDMFVSQCKQVFDFNCSRDLGHRGNIKSSVLVSGNELVAVVYCRGERGVERALLICSVGFGTHDETIEWQEVEDRFGGTVAMYDKPKICSLQL